MSIIEIMNRDCRREMMLPLSTKADANTPVKIKSVVERAKTYYLGYNQMNSMVSALPDNSVNFDGANLSFRGAKVVKVAEEEHYAVLYEPL